MDTFVVSKNVIDLNFDEMPPFHMGRYRRDLWIAGWFGSQIPVVTLSDDFCTYHIDHTPTLRDVSRPERIFSTLREIGDIWHRTKTLSFSLGEFFFEKGKEKGETIPNTIPKGNAPEPTE
jgi:hypothetical protein